MRGHIRKRGKTWSYVVDLGMRPAQRCTTCGPRGLFWIKEKRLEACPRCGGLLTDTEQRRQEWHSGFKTKAEASGAMSSVLVKLTDGTHVSPSTLTFGTFLEAEWLPSVAGRVRPTTLAGYTIHVRHHIIPAIGALKLQTVSPAHLNAFYADLIASGLSPKSIRNIHLVAHSAFADALRWGRTARNPAAVASPPRVPRGEMKVWNAQQLRAFLDEARSDRLYSAFLLACTSGMRRGEILGIRRSDLALDEGRLSVVRSLVLVGGHMTISEPKTNASRRSIALDPSTIAALRSHLRQQAEERLAWGPAYADSGLVFSRENGEAVHPETFTGRFAAIAKATGLPRIRFHDLRHSFATAALAAGVHPKIVSSRLGHSSVAVTMDRYSHVVGGMDREAADQVATLILGG